jgi:hypothetical protein
MRTFVPLCLLAAVVVTGPALAKKPNRSPAVVVISVDDDGNCHVSDKSPTIVAGNAAASVKGPRQVRFFYARGAGDTSKVRLTANAAQAHPNMLTLPQIGEAQAMGDSSASNVDFAGDEYRFQYVVEVVTEDASVTCDPDVVIKKGGG